MSPPSTAGWMPKPRPPSTRLPASNNRVSGQGTGSPKLRPKPSSTARSFHWKGKRDRCGLALLVGCGLRRGEAVSLTLADIQQRDGCWVVVDLYGKHGRIRTIPCPPGSNWLSTLAGSSGDYRRTPVTFSEPPRPDHLGLRSPRRPRSPWSGLTARNWEVRSSPTTCAASAPNSAAPPAANSNRSSSSWATHLVHSDHRTLPRFPPGPRARSE